MKTLLQGRHETHFLVVLLSGYGTSDVTVTIPADRRDENKIVEEDTKSPDARRTTFIADAIDSTVYEEGGSEYNGNNQQAKTDQYQ